MGIAQIYKKDPSLGISIAEKVGYFTAQESKNIGLNLLLAPVCDINNNSNNPVINLRAWGEDPETVKRLTCAYQSGVARANVLTCAKHFPGHGNSEVDSHIDLPNIQNDLSQLEKFEIIPFKSLIKQGVNSVMIGHLFFPKIDPLYPATLSKRIVNDLLRIQLQFDGLVITDALLMKAISNKYSSGIASVMAFNAGIDLILMPEDIDEAIDSLTEAVYLGKVSLERLNRSRERRQKQIDLISNKNDLKMEESDNKYINHQFLFEGSEFSKSIIKKSIYVRGLFDQKVNDKDINLIKIDDFDQLSNKFIPSLILPEAAGFNNLIIHPLSINPFQINNKNLLDFERSDNIKFLFQLFVRGKPFIGSEYNKQDWVETVKILEIQKRLSGIIVYGCPYLFDQIKRSIDHSIPLAYSPSQCQEAQNQILRRIFNSKTSHEKIDEKSSELFTD